MKKKYVTLAQKLAYILTKGDLRQATKLEMDAMYAQEAWDKSENKYYLENYPLYIYVTHTVIMDDDNPGFEEIRQFNKNINSFISLIYYMLTH